MATPDASASQSDCPDCLDHWAGTISSAIAVSGGIVVVVLLHFSARLSVRLLWAALWPALILVAVMTAFYAIMRDLPRAVSPVGQLIVGVLGAAVLMYTTRITDMVSLAGRVLGSGWSSRWR